MWNKIWPWLIVAGALMLIASCNVMLHKDHERTRAADTIQHAPVLLMEKSESGYYYNIYLDGFGNEDWRKEHLRLTLDKSVPKGAPSALFEYNTLTGKLGQFKDIILSFHDREDLAMFMGGGININVQAGRDSNIAVSKTSSKADACFISAIGGGGKDETYILR